MTTTPTTAAKRWPFVESPGDFAKRLERAIWSFSGDTLAAVRNVLIENPPTFATPAETAQPATPEPELLQAPQLPSDLIQRISEYGDARADDGNTGEALAVAIRAIRAWGAALATQASALQAAIPAQQPAVEPAAYRILERGEPIQATDEFLEEDATTWTRLDVHPITAGLFVGMPHAPGVLRPGRRPLASPIAQPGEKP